MDPMNPERRDVIRPESEVEPRVGETNGRSTSAAYLVRELLNETTALVRAELALARTELKENLDTTKKSAISIGAGAGVLVAGLLALVACAILVLDLFMPAWVAALIVGAATSIVGFVMIQGGKKKIANQSVRPERTIRSLNDDKQLVREHGARGMERMR